MKLIKIKYDNNAKNKSILNKAKLFSNKDLRIKYKRIVNDELAYVLLELITFFTKIDLVISFANA